MAYWEKNLKKGRYMYMYNWFTLHLKLIQDCKSTSLIYKKFFKECGENFLAVQCLGLQDFTDGARHESLVKELRS